MSIRNPWLQGSIVVVTTLVSGAGLAASDAVSAANAGWLGAFGLACAAALLVFRNAGTPARTMAQILYDTENPGRPGDDR